MPVDAYTPYKMIADAAQQLRDRRAANRTLAVNRQAGMDAVQAGDFTGAAATLAQAGNLADAETYSAKKAAIAQAQAAQQATALKAEHDYWQEAAPALHSVYDKGGPAALSQAYDTVIAPSLRQRGVTDEALQRYGALAKSNPSMFLQTVGQVAQKDLEFRNSGDEIFVFNKGDPNPMARYRAGRIVTQEGANGSKVTGWLDPGAATAGQATPPDGNAPQGGAADSVPQATGGAPGLASVPADAPPPPVRVSPQDRDALIRMTATEAGGQPIQGQAAVAHVALNRLGSRYGGATSLAGVVNAPHQFEGMGRASQVSPAAYQQAAKVVDAVLQGQIPDPTNGATQFINPQLQVNLGRAIPKWAQGQGQRIGAHVFYGGGAPAVGQAGQNASAQAAGPPSPAGFTPLYTSPAKAKPTVTPFSAAPDQAKKFGIDPALPGYFDEKGQPHVIREATAAETGADYSPAAIENIAQEAIAKGGNLPVGSTPVGKAGAGVRAMIQGRIAEIAMAKGLTGQAIVGGGAAMHADQVSLSKLTSILDNVTAAEKAAGLAGQFVLQGLAGSGGTKFPLFNKAWMAGRRATGDARVDVFISRLGTYVDEYAKVISGGTGSAAATEGVRAEARRRISEAASPQAFNDVISSMDTEMKFRRASLQDGVDAIHNRLTGNSPVAANASPGRQRGWTKTLPPAQLARAKQYFGAKGPAGDRSNPMVPQTVGEYNRIRPGKWFIDDDGMRVQKSAP